nr:hypothetical protein Hi04_10k_c3807_00027 [uncultured bacterium]
MSEPDVSSAGRRQRRHKRVTTREVTAAVSSDGAQLSFTVVNLSIGGALVTGAQAPPRGEAVDIELKLKGARAVTVRGQVVHVRSEGIGIAFEGMGATETVALEKLIASAEAQNALPPPLPAHRGRTDELPAVVPRPDDAFWVEHDPRPPRGGSPDERAEYLRVLIKNRDDGIRRGRTTLAAIIGEADALRAHATRLKARLDTAASQHSLTEVALGAARAEAEKLREAQLVERATSADLLEQEQRRTLEAIAAVSGLEASMRRHEMEAKHALQEAENARREATTSASDASNVRRAREELMIANRRAMEGQAALSKEKAARAAVEKALADEHAAAQRKDDELKGLKEEVARLKTKLINAETAIERMASRSASKASRGSTVK